MALPGGLGEGSLILIGAWQLYDTDAAKNCLFLIEQASLVDMTTNSKTIKSLWVFCLLSQATILCRWNRGIVCSESNLVTSEWQFAQRVAPKVVDIHEQEGNWIVIMIFFPSSLGDKGEFNHILYFLFDKSIPKWQASF